jgi:putative membrane protein
MKWTGLSAIACAAMLTVACGGDGRDREDDGRSAMRGSGEAAEDRYAARETDGAALLVPGPDDRTMVGTSGRSMGQATAGQAHGADGDARHFVRTASMTSHAEVELGKLASERAQSQDVKQFAQMMIRDHTRSGNELAQAVTPHDVTPSKEIDQKHQQLMTRLRALQGAEFDREYMKAMVDGHREVKSMLEKRAGDGRTAANRNDSTAAPGSRTAGTSGSANSALDVTVNQWASKSLPTVEQHLQRAERIHASLGNK